MGRSRRRIVIAALAAVCVAMLAALDWPTDDRNAVLSFGSVSSGRLDPGVSMASTDGLVHSSGSGDLCFALDKPLLADGLPSSLGSFQAVEGAEGLICIYSGLERGSLATYLKSVKPGDILGRIDPRGSGLRFLLFDRLKARFVNPFIFMPPPTDKRQPSIRSVALVSGKQVFPLGETRSVKQGTYDLVAELSDPEPAVALEGTLRAPFSVVIFIDGVERLRYVYEMAKGENGRLGFFGSGISSADFLRRDGRMVLGSYLLNRGKVSILIVVKDFSGNEREAGFTVNIE